MKKGRPFTKKEIEIVTRYNFVLGKSPPSKFLYDFEWLNEKIISANTEEKMKELFLMDLSKEIMSCRDNYLAFRCKSGKSWKFGYNDDLGGELYVLPDACLPFLMNGRDKYRVDYQVTK